jgi:peptidoglycan hydrolase-like protein with peptidoglycan-binding domain
MLTVSTVKRVHRTCLAASAALAIGLVGASSASAMTILHLGIKGPRVGEVQRQLHIRVNRLYDHRTYLAVRRFQANHHLLVDGEVGPRTWAALHRPASHHRAAHHARRHSNGILHLGIKGPRVSQVQHLLHIRANRLFDHRTYLAVRKFQRNHHLLVDGQVGPHTWAALHRKTRHHRVRSHRHRRSNGILHLGIRGPRVGEVQRRLHIRVNRLYDRRTYLAVRRFQANHGLMIDGQVGPQTWGALHRRPAPHIAGSSLAVRALHVAMQYRGVKYVWGGSTPRGFDCSGLIWYAYLRLGVHIPRVTYGQWAIGRHVPRSQLRPGDLLFFHERGHVGIFMGHGWFLHAPMTGQVIHASRFAGWYTAHYDGAVRIG